jgi:threonine/homoserine/homoserine lactone efflux protein
MVVVNTLPEFLLTSLLIELTPGPNMAYLAALSLSEGRRAGFAAVAGVTLGLLMIGLVAVLGFATFLEQSPLLRQGLRYAGAAFLLYLAYEAWRGAADEAGAAQGARGAFVRALITNILNPKAAAFYLTVLPGFVPAGSAGGWGWPVGLVLIYVAIATMVHAGLVLFAGTLRPYLVEGQGERLVRRGFALALALVALWFFWGTRG